MDMRKYEKILPLWGDVFPKGRFQHVFVYLGKDLGFVAALGVEKVLDIQWAGLFRGWRVKSTR
jgi:hypothetical protein